MVKVRGLAKNTKGSVGYGVFVEKSELAGAHEMFLSREQHPNRYLFSKQITYLEYKKNWTPNPLNTQKIVYFGVKCLISLAPSGLRSLFTLKGLPQKILPTGAQFGDSAGFFKGKKIFTFLSIWVSEIGESFKGPAMRFWGSGDTDTPDPRFGCNGGAVWGVFEGVWGMVLVWVFGGKGGSAIKCGSLSLLPGWLPEPDLVFGSVSGGLARSAIV